MREIREILSMIVALLLIVLMLYLIFGRLPKRLRGKSILRNAITVLICLMLPCLSLFVLGGGLVFIWPSYYEWRLLGLTPDQIVERLGPPDYDPRRFDWKDGDPFDPLTFRYDWNWDSAMIVFKNNRVVHVFKDGK